MLIFNQDCQNHHPLSEKVGRTNTKWNLGDEELVTITLKHW
jgi:hypothetical protein